MGEVRNACVILVGKREGKSEIYGSHGDEYEDGCLLGCFAV
jgi:hypothetical protein